MMLARIQNVLVSVLGESVRADITVDASMESVKEWDSLSFIKVLSAVEAEFGVRIEADDAMDLTSVVGIQALLSRKGL